ncbi:MAG: hypothetical protein AB1478_11605 [Nitrospirota bacterium]
MKTCKKCKEKFVPEVDTSLCFDCIYDEQEPDGPSSQGNTCENCGGELEYRETITEKIDEYKSITQYYFNCVDCGEEYIEEF